METKSRNVVAIILKAYSVLNAVSGIIITLWMRNNLPGIISQVGALFFLLLVVLSSFLIFTFGEVVSILAEIRDNTKQVGNQLNKTSQSIRNCLVTNKTKIEVPANEFKAPKSIKIEPEQTTETLHLLIQNGDLTTKINTFVEKASSCVRIKEVYDLWKTFDWDDEASSEIGKKISDMAEIERLYGGSPDRVEKLLNDIKKMI